MTKPQLPAHLRTPQAHEIHATEHSWSGFTLREVNLRATPGTALLGPHSERMRMTLERSPNAPIRLSELAALTGLSMSHFSVAFKQSTGMPPHRWQLQARVLNAKQLLRRRELRISEVAKLTGFVDQSHFTRTFRQFVRLTPMTWRREMLG